jgi:3-oxoacyl-[acyl-carrier-protein] synthase II
VKSEKYQVQNAKCKVQNANLLLKGDHHISGRRAVVTGFGLITPLGNGKEVVWNNLVNKKTGAFHREDLAAEGFRFTKACRVDGFEGVAREQKGRSYTLRALEEALQQASLDLPVNTGIFTGATLGENGGFESIAEGRQFDPGDFTIGSFNNCIKERYKLTGISLSYGTACAAGNYALGAASEAIENGMIDVAVAGGIEPFSRVAMTGFSRSRAMTSDLCRPFDRRRDGMMLGEGAAVFILENEARALERGARPLAVIGSLGLSCDAFHPTAPLQDGTGIEAAIRNVLNLEKIEAHQVDWICAHGSGTLLSDKAESMAIQRVFGAYAVPVSGYKGAFGHALGAASAIESAICILALGKNEIPPTTNLEERDPELEIDAVTDTRQKDLTCILNCSYAFGGLNSALIIKKWK